MQAWTPQWLCVKPWHDVHAVLSPSQGPAVCPVQVILPQWALASGWGGWLAVVWNGVVNGRLRSISASKTFGNYDSATTGICPPPPTHTHPSRKLRSSLQASSGLACMRMYHDHVLSTCRAAAGHTRPPCCQGLAAQARGDAAPIEAAYFRACDAVPVPGSRRGDSATTWPGGGRHGEEEDCMDGARATAGGGRWGRRRRRRPVENRSNCTFAPNHCID